ncbi:hypothetical protein [Litoribacillus peritrichatus]|uniref:Lipoprotein n=1 Tax=Litoribacillus peritrichatus TaxID=718191 RepID=A0ABP7MZS6_9GAMM
MKIITLVIALAVLAGCAAPQKVVSEAERQQQAVQWAIKEEVKLRVVAAECAQLDGILEAAANYAVRDWHLRNGDLVNSADDHFTYHMAMFNQGNWEGATSMSQQMVYAAVQKAEIEAAAMIGVEPEDKRSVCMKTLDQYKQGSFDLVKVNPLMSAQLNDLKSSRSVQKERLALQKAVVKEAPKSGRSLYLVEKVWAQKGCARGAVSALVSKWPDEVYHGICKDESIVIACKWGNCKELK